MTPLPRLHTQQLGLGSLPHRRSRSWLAGVAAHESALGRSIDWPGTVLAKGRAQLMRRHLRVRRVTPIPAPHYFFLLDCSASMVERGALARAKGLLVAWLRAVRRQAAQAALICYGGDQADVRFGPAVPSGWNERWIDPIGGGGGTPLALGVQTASALASRQRRHGAERLMYHDTPHSAQRPTQHSGQGPLQKTLIVLTDGRTRELPPRPEGFQHIVIIDFESQTPALDRCARLAEQWSAQCVHIGDIASI